MAVAPHFGPCSALLSESLPQTQVGAVPSSAVCVSKAEFYQLLVLLPHALFYFLLYFSSLFYLNCVTVSKWLCFTLHNLFTYSYYLFFPVCLPGITHTRLAASGERGARPGGRASPSSPPRPTISDRFLLFGCVNAVLAVYGSGWQAVHILSIIVDLSSPFCSHISICFFNSSYLSCRKLLIGSL